MSWKKEYNIKRKLKRQKRISKGLCVECGAETGGHIKCKACREKHTERTRAIRGKLKENALCQECGKIKVEKGQYFCDTCKEKKYGKRTCQSDGCNNISKRNHDYCESCFDLRRFGNKALKVYFVNCSVCGKMFTSRWESAKHCSSECRFAVGYYGMDVKVIERDCKECGKQFRTYNLNKLQVYCSKKCSKKAGGREGKHRRRLRKKQQFVEIINIGVLFQRDTGHCQICGKKLNRKRVVPHPMAVTIDHVIPLSKGGEHSYRNTQLACFQCNSIKGNGSVDGGEQLRLFG